jgi:hypothetical protein
MFFRVNGLQIKSLAKAVANNDKIAVVDIIANHLTEDTDGETVLKEAFTPETVKEFLDIGVIEFWHESKNPLLTKEEKNAMLLGKPVAFRWESGLPVVTAHLTKTHPIVAEMLPHLEAENPVYSASIGGSKVVLEAQGRDGQVHHVIPKIKWDHLAIAPSNMVVNREPGVNVRLLQKANESNLFMDFDSINTFKRSAGQFFAQEAVLSKALSAPASVSDMQNTPGGVITKQSLEKTISNLTFSEDEAEKLLDTIIKVNQGNVPKTESEYKTHFKDDGNFADKSWRLFSKYFAKNSKKEI